MDSLESPNGLQQLPNNHFRHDSQVDRLSWEYHNISVTRVPGFGFGIAVSGGRDNPHFANGDPSIAVSDVLKGGPAEDRLQVNDRIISVNGVCLENVEYATAVHVLRDSGNTVTLVLKRRVPNINTLSSNQSLGAYGSNASAQQTIKLYLTKASKKDDFGIVLGCRLFVKEISAKARDQLASNGYTLQEGDVVSRIHNTNTNDSMSLKEAKKIIDGCKERLNLVVLRELPNNNSASQTGMHSPAYSHTAQVSNCSNVDDSFLTGGSSYSAQNLYVQPPTRPAMSTMLDDKNNLTPRGRSRNPLMNVSSLQLELPSIPQNNSFSRSRNGIDEGAAIRPPPPKGEDFYSSRRQLYEDDPLQRSKQSVEPRFISFKKEGSVGIRLTGGNEAGIFVTAVQPGSPASLQGLTPGDKILKVNDMDMHEVTREEAVLFLLSLQDRIDLIVQHCKEEYDNVVANQRGDSFHVKTHFHYNSPSKGEMPFKAGDVFRVVDTLHNGVVGAWQVLKVGRGQQEMQRGVIPNKSRAEELATAQFNATKKELNSSESRTSFFRRKRSNHRRSKSLSKENWDDVVFSDSISKFPAYERVVLRHPGFVRPVVLFGPVADLAREKLTKDFPDKYIMPLQDNEKSNTKSGIVRLSNIRDIMDRGKHALLDITPNAVDKLNYAQFYPVVIFLKADTKHLIKQLRQGIPKSAHKSSKKLHEQCQKLDRMWSHIFSKTIILSDIDTWYRKLRDCIDQLQSGAVWMSESKPAESLSDDFLFPMTTSRLSYASSPESDLELSPGPSASLSLGNLPQLVKSSSDPSIATNQDLLERDRDQNIGDGLLPTYTSPFEHLSAHPRKVFDSDKPNNDNKNSFNQDDFESLQLPPAINAETGQPLYGMVPELPPRIDRASKPAIPTDLLASPSNARSMPSGTYGRTSKERHFSNPENDKEDFHGAPPPPHQLNSSHDKRDNNSLDRHQRMTKNPGANKNNGSYDSVSSYDSCNTTQISMRLGPNAPDDLKSVPNTNNRSQIHGPDPSMSMNLSYNDTPIMNNLSFEHSKSASISKGSNIHGSPIKPPHSNDNYSKHIRERAPRPSHLPMDQMSPRKSHPPTFETKTDYGKYSRTNSASQADYIKSPISPQIGKPPNIAFKPVPPPKPKNYRPPIQNNSGGWENGEPISPRSPNGFFYQSNAHFHSPQNMINNQISASNNQHGPPPPAHHNMNHSMGQMQQYSGMNNFNGNQSFSGHYMHRPPVMERHALDLAGSREQRGSAFELYRKPQVGNPNHHNLSSDMESHQASANLANAINEHHQQYYHMMPAAPDLPPPPPLPPPKSQKLKFFKAPLTAIKNAFSSPKKSLQRQSSMVEPKLKQRSIVRRQHSMVERKSQFEGQIDPVMLRKCQIAEYDYMQRYMTNQRQPYDKRSESTYQNLQTESFYRTDQYPSYPEQENLYANKSLIEFERRIASSNPQPSRQIIRRHSIADRTTTTFQENKDSNMRNRHPKHEEEDVYQTRSGAFLMNEPRHIRENQRRDTDGIYQNRREMHLNHLYQTKKEMQQRIHQGRIEAEKALVESPVDDTPSGNNNKDPIYQSRRELKERGFRTRTELRDHIYQTRMEAMRSLAEPKYMSRREIREIASEPPRSRVASPEYQSQKEIVNRRLPGDISVLETVAESHICNQSDQQKSVAATNHNDPDPFISKRLTDVTIRESIPCTSQQMMSKMQPPSSPMRLTAPSTNSEMSIESNFVSEASLPLGPPNAQSTPYSSEVTLPVPLREQSTTRGCFDENGGTLCDNIWNVSIDIPKGAIPSGRQQEIYFTVTDPRLSQTVAGPPLDMENGETMLSPLVMCGPQGLEFLIPVTLNIPHYAGRTTSLGLTLKATDSEKNLKTNWDNIDLPSNAAAHTVSVKVDHF